MFPVFLNCTMKYFSLVSLILFFVSCESSENFENLKKVKVGMPYRDAVKIMENEPISIEDAFWNDSLFVAYYDSPVAASDNYGIIYSKRDSIVVGIEWGD